MFIDRRGYRIVKDGGASAEPWSKGPGGDVLAEMPDKDPGDLHQRNFLECVRSRQQPNCTVEMAANAVAGPHLANLAMFAGKKMKLEPAFSGDAYDTSKKLRDIPKTLRDATERLDTSKMLRQALGDAVVDHYVHTAKWEQFEYDRRVTDWEVRRGFEQY